MTCYSDVILAVQDCMEQLYGTRPNKEKAAHMYRAVSYAIESCLLNGQDVRIPGVGLFYRAMTRGGHFGRDWGEYEPSPTVRCKVSETLRKKVKRGVEEDAY